jgi:hypothetical protein
MVPEDYQTQADKFLRLADAEPNDHLAQLYRRIAASYDLLTKSAPKVWAMARRQEARELVPTNA